MSSSRKKAIFRKFTRDWLAGYLPADGFAADEGLEVLDLAGKVVRISIRELKWVCYVRDFNSGELNNPERLERKTFAGRPRGDGLFIRARLKDGDLIEGLAANDLSLIGSQGLFLTPPDLRSNTQRLWIPRSSLEQLEVVAVLGGSRKKPTMPAEAEPVAQEKLF